MFSCHVTFRAKANFQHPDNLNILNVPLRKFRHDIFNRVRNSKKRVE